MEKWHDFESGVPPILDTIQKFPPLTVGVPFGLSLPGLASCAVWYSGDSRAIQDQYLNLAGFDGRVARQAWRSTLANQNSKMLLVQTPVDTSSTGPASVWAHLGLERKRARGC